MGTQKAKRDSLIRHSSQKSYIDINAKIEFLKRPKEGCDMEKFRGVLGGICGEAEQFSLLFQLFNTDSDCDNRVLSRDGNHIFAVRTVAAILPQELHMQCI